MALTVRAAWDRVILSAIGHNARDPEKLLGSGAVAGIPTTLNLANGEQFWRVPGLQDLDTILGDDDQRLQAGTDMTLNAIDGWAQYGPIVARGDAIKEGNLSKMQYGQLLSKYGPQIAIRIANQWEATLRSSIKGAFATALATSHASSVGDTRLTNGLIGDTIAEKLGDRGEDLNLLVVNSMVKSDLKKQGLTTYVDAGQYGENLVRTGQLLEVDGKRVLVNDRLSTAISVVLDSVANATDEYTATAHGFNDGDQVTFSGSDIPAGLTAGTTYYVISAADDTFKVSETSGGSAVTITDDGTGDITVTSKTQFYSYIMAPRSLYLGFQADFGVVQGRDELLEGGTDYLKWVASYSTGVDGVTYDTDEGFNPTRATLETGATWSATSGRAAAETRILRIRHKIGA